MMNCKFCKADCVRSGEDRELEKRNCYKPMTNGDRIRAMTDEELADRLYWLDKDSIPFCKNLPYCEHRLEADEFISDSECMACMLEWLKQPCSEVES